MGNCCTEGWKYDYFVDAFRKSSVSASTFIIDAVRYRFREEWLDPAPTAKGFVVDAILDHFQEMNGFTVFPEVYAGIQPKLEYLALRFRRDKRVLLRGGDDALLRRGLARRDSFLTDFLKTNGVLLDGECLRYLAGLPVESLEFADLEYQLSRGACAAEFQLLKDQAPFGAGGPPKGVLPGSPEYEDALCAALVRGGDGKAIAAHINQCHGRRTLILAALNAAVESNVLLAMSLVEQYSITWEEILSVLPADRDVRTGDVALIVGDFITWAERRFGMTIATSSACAPSEHPAVTHGPYQLLEQREKLD